MGETLFSSTYQPNPRSALDVLAFVLTPIAAFASGPDEIEAVAEILGAAKLEAIERWQSLRCEARQSQIAQLRSWSRPRPGTARRR